MYALDIIIISLLSLASTPFCAIASSVPAAIFDVPSPNIEYYRVLAVGVTDYACKSGSWVISGANAKLSEINNESVQVGAGKLFTTLDADPVFTYQVQIGNSSVSALVIATRPSPNPNSFPEITLVAQNASLGIFESMTYFQMLNTFGAAAPPTACTDGQSQGVPGRSTFIFYRLLK